ncbi:NRDE-2, necessary for RNA interference-domain-containing protein [Xylariomycetidae sp. FL0641]|nr:NRDE-2, necessary for RNA interference-domain-containing protein [Xylariomycetidae sp. FL0641]
MSPHDTADRKTKRSSVPKFSSFKPRVEPVNPAQSESAQTPVGTDDESRRRLREDESRISKRSHSPARDRQHHRQHQTTAASHTSDRPLPLHSPHPPHSKTSGASTLYVVDKRGDPLIRRYGANNRRDVPEYRRFGSGRVLGVEGFMRTDRSGVNDEFYIRTSTEGGPVLGSDRKSLLAKGLRSKSQPIRIRREQPQVTDAATDYLPLRESKKRKRLVHSESGESSGEDGPAYRSIHGKSKHHEHSDSDEMHESDLSADEVKGQGSEAANQRSIELTRKVWNDPEDIETWFELVHHQDTLLQEHSDGRTPTAAEIKSFADVKLSMLEQALSHAKDEMQREKLQIGIMREGSRIWDLRTVSKRWAESLQSNPKSFRLRKAYLDFRQSTLSTLQFEEVRRLYVDWLRSISQDVSELSSATNSYYLCTHMIYVFLRLTRFLADTGFVELATAAWQATLELTFARPSTTSTDDSAPSACDVLPSFGEFWESEVPRLGEDQAHGWSSWVRNPDAQEPPAPKVSAIQDPPSTRDGYKAWAFVEHQRARNASIPARTLDEGADDDPFRVVMFDDIQDLVCCLPPGIDPKVHHLLLDAFLIFCRLPPAFSSDSIVQEMTLDVFLVRNSATSIATNLPAQSHKADTSPDNREEKGPEFFSEYQQMARTPSVLFGYSHWFRYLPGLRDALPTQEYLWISNTLKYLVHSAATKDLGPYYLAFESVNTPGNEKKVAKALLKQDSTNVELYIGYAILEWEKGNKAAAHNVLTSAMNLSTISSHDRCRMCTTVAWMDLEDGAMNRSTWQLCNIAEENIKPIPGAETSPTSSTQVLKARQVLESNRDYLISSGELMAAVAYAEGLALLEYATRRSGKEPRSGTQGDIWSAISSISTCSDDLVSRGLGGAAEHEMLLQSAARLLYYHVTHGPHRLGYLREQLTKYIHFFPQNTIFLNLFAWREERLSIDDRVRSILHKAVLVEPHDTMGGHVFAIRHEMQTGNAHSTRAAFERALARARCKNHPGLWISYIRFCHDNKALRSKAKDVFYRALQNCPWSKEVFMEAFATLVRDVDSAELKSVYSTLCDKGLRVHVEMDEFVEEWRRSQKEKQSKKQ